MKNKKIKNWSMGYNRKRESNVNFQIKENFNTVKQNQR